MKCQYCQMNDATVNMQMQINNQRMQMHLCNECFQELQGKMANPGNFFSNEGAFSGDFFQQGGFQAGGQGQTGTRTKQRSKKGNGLLDKVIGRDNEIKRVIETLNRRNKNNPVLIGEPGVGKTAIAEGLAVKIVEGSVPAKLMNKEVYLLDVASLVANTGIRGQFEE